MSKTNSNSRWKLSSLLLLALMLLGITNAKADKYDLTLGQNNTPAANDYYLFTPSENGYLLISFDEAINMTGNEGVFFTYVGGWEDTVQDAAVCNGTPTGKTGSVVYCGGTYTEYTGVTKVAYKVNSGTSYCIWGGTVNIQLAPFTATFSTTMPDLNGGTGGDGGGDAEGTDIGTFPAGIDSTVKVEPATDGYVLITFDSATDMVGQYGVFYTWHPSWGADVTMTAIESNGTDAGSGNVPAYGAYQQYTDVTKVLYQVKGGEVYCVWNAPVGGTITFYTEKPNLNGGNGGDNEPEGTEMGSFPTGIDSTVKVEPATDGYVLITFDSAIDMVGQYGVFYTWHPSWGADVTMTAIESNGTDAGSGNVPAYGAYQQYTDVTKVLYEVKGGQIYCVWNAPAPGTITFYTEKPSLNGGGGGSDTPTPSKKVIYICDNTQYKDPSEPLVVELGDDGNYTFTLDMTSGIRMSTTKSNNTSWNGFEVGEFNMYAGEAADRRVAENMLGRPIRLWQGADEYGPAGWLYFPWIGQYTGVIPADLTSITLTTTTEKPAIDYPLTDPEEGELEAGFGGVALIWASEDVVKAVPEMIYITNPDPNGENLTVEGGDLEITFTKLDGVGGFNTYAEGEEIDGNVIAIDINPESKYYSTETGALINPYPYPVEISVVLPPNSITVNDVPNDKQIVRNFIIPAGDENPELTPVGRIIVPVPGSETVPGFQWVYSTYSADGTWLTDYLPLEFNENYVNPNGKSYPEAMVNVPGSTSTFPFRIIISDNDLNEEPGYDGPGKNNPNYKQVDNTALLKNFYYNEFGIFNSWQKEGDYKVTVPAGVFYITLRNEDGSLSDTRILNAETTLVYHCLGQHDIANYGQLRVPKYDKYVSEVTSDTNFGTVELDNEVIVAWATYTKNDVPTPLTLGDGKVTVSLNDAAPVEVPVTLLDHWADNVVNGTNYNDPGLRIDLSQFNNAPGTYVISLPQGIVYSEETDFQNNLYNMAQKITFEVEAPNMNLVNFEFDADETLIKSGDIKMFGTYDSNTGGYSFLEKITSSPVEFKADAYPASVNFALVDNEGLVMKASSADAPAGSWSFEQAPAGSWKFDEGNGTNTPVWTLTIQEGANNATFVLYIGENLPETPALVADDFEMTFVENNMTPVTTDVYVSLENVEEMYSYAGYQFDITLPFGMEVTQAALGTGIVGMEGYEKPISVAQVNNMPPTTYRVVGFFDTTTATENIAKLTISGVYNEEMVNGEEYPVTIQNTVVFSTPLGEDRKDVEGSVSTVTIYIENKNATGVDIKSCRLLWPSYTSREGDIEYITEGQAVELTAVLEPTDAADEITWTATVNGSDNLGVQVIVNSDDNPNNLVAMVSTDWEMLNLTEPITVVIRAQGVDEEVYDEYELMVKPIVLGDANDNNEVNVADVVTTANYIANGDNQATIADFVSEFDHPNADVVLSDNDANGNVNGITVSDVTAIVNIALGVQEGRNARRHVSTYRSNDRLVAARVSDSSIAVALEGQTAYAALQVEIEMPAGMSVYGVEKGARAAGHELTYGVNASGNVVVVLYSLDNSSFAGEGSLFTLQVEGGNAEDMRLVNVFASDSQSNGYELDGLYSSEVTGIFGIDAELASGVRYFTVDGVQVTNPEKGQILIRVAGNKVEKTIIK